MLDFTQRYSLRLHFETFSSDYPRTAEAAGLPPVRLYVTLLFGETGRLLDLRVDRFCSASTAYAPFEREFAQAALQVFRRAKLLSSVYQFEGRPVPFLWPTLLIFERK